MNQIGLFDRSGTKNPPKDEVKEHIIFDAEEGSAKKEQGMNRAAAHKREILEAARDIAREIAVKNNGLCNSDLVNLEMQRRGYSPRCLGNAAGSIFTTDEWQFTGNRIKSSKVAAHAREIKVWRLLNKAAA